MTVAYLNGIYLPLDQARISPMDRGFLFGDGIYEVIPSHDGKLIGFGPHIDRMNNGLNAIEIQLEWTHDQWRDVCSNLLDKNNAVDAGIYLQVSRGADNKRNHAYPAGITPTVFGFVFELPTAPLSDPTAIKPLRISSAEDMRWKRCALKSTALLGNVIHIQKAVAEGNEETLLFNAAGEVTEGGACNAFIVKHSVVATPPLDHQILAGITRMMLLDILRKDASIPVEERVVTVQEARDADEIWFTSSTKEVWPVVALDGIPVGTGEVGPVWESAYRLYTDKKYEY